MSGVGIILIGVILWGLIYAAASAPIWLLLPPSLLLALQLGGLLTPLWSIPFWLAYALGLSLYALPEQRRRWISTPLLKRFRQVMPAISRTEQEALQAGSVGWDSELFSGQPDWQKLFSQPAPQLSAEEQAFINGPLEQLCRMLDDWQITHQDYDLPPEVWAFIKQCGLFGLIIPKKYGGLEFSALAHSTIVMKLASRSITAAVTVMVPNSLGPAKLLLHYGSDAQRRRYLFKLASGEEIPCFALTGPQAGSDAGAMPDSGVVEYGEFKGEQVLGIRLNWEKRYITLAPVATLIGLAFKLHDPAHLLGEESEPGITLALIPRQTPGVSIGKRHLPLNIPFQNGPISGRDVFIPLDWVIGGRDGIGQGWRMLMESLAEGRGISLPALATGASKAACRYTGAYARIRRQFGQPIGRFEGIEEALALIAGANYQMDAARLLTLAALDRGEHPSVVTAIVKYHLTERYREVINQAMDIQAGSGICLGPNNLLARPYQAIPIAITVEGANILTRNMIIFGQGALRAHPYLLRELNAALLADSREAVIQFDQALFGHAHFILGNLARSLWLGLSRALFASTPLPGFAGRSLQHLQWMSSGFALAADLTLLSLGGALKRKERLSARLGDILSELYIASALLKHFADEGSQQEDLPLLRWAMADSLIRIQRAFSALLHNLPLRPLAWLLRIAIFPSGMPFKAASDQLDDQLARLLQTPGNPRDRLTAHVFSSNDPGEPAGRLELALKAVSLAAPIEKTLRQARRAGQIIGDSRAAQLNSALELGIITHTQTETLRQAEQWIDQVIQVDAFDGLTPQTRQAVQEESQRGVA